MRLPAGAAENGGGTDLQEVRKVVGVEILVHAQV